MVAKETVAKRITSIWIYHFPNQRFGQFIDNVLAGDLEKWDAPTEILDLDKVSDEEFVERCERYARNKAGARNEAISRRRIRNSR